MKTVNIVCALALVSFCGSVSAQSVQEHSGCARLGTFTRSALSQVQAQAIPLKTTFIYRKFAVNTPLADQLTLAAHKMQAEQKSPEAVAAELQSECERSMAQASTIKVARAN